MKQKYILALILLPYLAFPNKQIHAFLDQKEKLHLPTWSLQYEVLPTLLKQHFSGKSDIIGVEIGVAFGTHSARLLKEETIVKLYSVNPYLHFKQSEYPDGMNFNQPIHDVLYKRAKNLLAPFGERSELLRMTSEKAATLFEEASLDFIYIDGNHTYKHVRKDLNLWWKKVKSGGIFSGDDYPHPGHPGVKKAVDEFLKEKKLIINTKPLFFWWVIKP